MVRGGERGGGGERVQGRGGERGDRGIGRLEGGGEEEEIREGLMNKNKERTDG